MHTRYWEAGARGGQQKADHRGCHRGCRKQTRFLELGGGVGSQKGKPEQQLGIQVSEVGVLGEPGKTRQG